MSNFVTRTYTVHHVEYYDNRGIRQIFDTFDKKFNIDDFLKAHGIRSIKAVKKYDKKTKIMRMSLDDFYQHAEEITDQRYK